MVFVVFLGLKFSPNRNFAMAHYYLAKMLAIFDEFSRVNILKQLNSIPCWSSVPVERIRGGLNHKNRKNNKPWYLSGFCVDFLVLARFPPSSFRWFMGLFACQTHTPMSHFQLWRVSQMCSQNLDNQACLSKSVQGTVFEKNSALESVKGLK